MKNKALPVAFAVIAAALVCTATVLTLKLTGNKPSINPDSGTSLSQTTEKNHPAYIETRFTELADVTENDANELSTEQTENKTTTEPKTTDTQTTTKSETTTVTQTVTQIATTVVNTAFKDVFTLPKAPQYIPPDTDLNFEKINLASYKYNPDGNFYYTDDKECWQKNFGFNEVYDKFAPLTMMYYDTVRTTFEYGGKEWLVQIWKGQYGMAFVGGEVGIYTRNLGSIGSHFVCADKEDWLNMEMAFMWDEYETGEYRAVFNRNYEKYWWATGFVVGFPNGSLRKTLTEFRLVTHITFKDTEMANAFCKAFENNGFTKVSKLNNNSPDTFVQVGPDVAFVWQNINQK